MNALTSFVVLIGQVPSLSISPSHLLVDYADRIELICQSHLIHPFDIHWLFNGELVEQRQSIGHVSDGSALRIERATDEHTGVYQCFSNQTFDHRVISSMPVTLTVRRKCRDRCLDRVENCNHSSACSAPSQSQSSNNSGSTLDSLLRNRLWDEREFSGNNRMVSQWLTDENRFSPTKQNRLWQWNTNDRSNIGENTSIFSARRISSLC